MNFTTCIIYLFCKLQGSRLVLFLFLSPPILKLGGSIRSGRHRRYTPRIRHPLGPTVYLFS